MTGGPLAITTEVDYVPLTLYNKVHKKPQPAAAAAGGDAYLLHELVPAPIIMTKELLRRKWEEAARKDFCAGKRKSAELL